MNEIKETLYELTGEYLQLLELADDPEVDEEVFADTLEGLGGMIEMKAENYARVITELERIKAIKQADADSFEKQMKRKKDHVSMLDNRIAKMKQNLKASMIATGKTKFDTDNFKFYVKKNAPSTIIDDESKIPDKYFKVKKEVQKSLIKEDINNGIKVDGAHLEASETVIIK